MVTRVSPAIDALAEKSDGAIRLVPAQNAPALADAIRTAKKDWQEERLARPGPHLLCGPKEVGMAAHKMFNKWFSETR